MEAQLEGQAHIHPRMNCTCEGCHVVWRSFGYISYHQDLLVQRDDSIEVSQCEAQPSSMIQLSFSFILYDFDCYKSYMVFNYTIWHRYYCIYPFQIGCLYAEHLFLQIYQFCDTTLHTTDRLLFHSLRLRSHPPCTMYFSDQDFVGVQQIAIEHVSPSSGTVQ